MICGPDGVALACGLALPDALGEAEGLGLGLGVGEGVGLGVGEAAFAEAPDEGEALGLGLGVGRLKATTQLKPLLCGQRNPEDACETG